MSDWLPFEAGKFLQPGVYLTWQYRNPHQPTVWNVLGDPGPDNVMSTHDFHIGVDSMFYRKVEMPELADQAVRDREITALKDTIVLAEASLDQQRERLAKLEEKS